MNSHRPSSDPLPSIAEILEPRTAKIRRGLVSLRPREFSTWQNLLAGGGAFLAFYVFRQAMSPILADSITFFLYLVPILAASYLVGRVAGWTSLVLALVVSYFRIQAGTISVRDDRPYMPFVAILALTVGLILVFIANRLRDELLLSNRLVNERERALTVLNSVIDHSTVGKALFDQTGHCVRVNALLAQFARLAPESCIGLHYQELIPLSSRDQDMFHQTLRDRRPGRPAHVIFEDEGNHSQQRRFCEVSFYPIGSGEQIYGVAATATDVTELKLIEVERERLLESERLMRGEAERVNKIKDEFMAILSHELRTPLTTILGWTELAKDRTHEKEFLDSAIDQIAESTQTQVKMIEDLLDISRINTGQLRLECSVLEVADIIEASLRLLKVKIEAKDLNVVSHLDSRGLVFGDPARLSQVFANIIGNAIKFTPKGGKIEIAIQESADESVITISDNGEGIEADVLPFVFERFRQADSGRSRRYGGLGLGLAIVKQLVLLHGGLVGATSDGPGRGATITVRLPRAESVSLTGERPARTAPASADGLLGLQILVVDDDGSTRQVVQLMLESVGATVETADSGQTALDAIQRRRFDVVLSDIGMPEMDGYQFLAAVRSLPDPIARATPAVALSAFAREEDRRLSLKHGFSSHVTKPLQTSALVKAILSSTYTGVGSP